MGLYVALFLASGFCSLIYEVVWLRVAMAHFGVGTPTVSIVLSVFMAGLAAGSWGAGRLSRAVDARPAAVHLRLYAVAELLIGVSALLVPRQLGWGHYMLAWLGRGNGWESAGYYALSGVWIAATLVPYCACMGATFPLAMAAIRRSGLTESRHSFSALYLANVLGATAGTLASAFVLIELLGFHGTLLVTATLNAMIAAAAFGASLMPAPVAPATALAPADGGRERRAEGAGPRILGALVVTGLISMAMEVVWIRQFTPYLGTEVYAFAALLAIYLAATFLGSRAYRRWLRSHAPDAPSGIWLVLAGAGLLPLLSADPRVLQHPAVANGVVRVAVGIVPFCVAVGFLTPRLVDRWSSGEPARAGAAYACNVIGGIVGPLVAGFFLLPWLGERGALVVLTLPFFVLGALATARKDAARAGRQGAPPARLAYALMGLLALGVITVTEGFEEAFPRREVRRDYVATVMATSYGEAKFLAVNGRNMTTLTTITKMMAHLPLALLGRPPQNALAICFGMGTTFRSLLTWDIPVTAVELVPSVPAVFGYYHADGPALLRSPRARVVIDDGRRFLTRSPVRYDVIAVDPPLPVEAAGSSLLYSREFNVVVKQRLAPDGILQQWLPPGTEWTIAISVAKALTVTFPHVRVFLLGTQDPTHFGGALFLASAAPIQEAPASVLAARLTARARADLLEWEPRSTVVAEIESYLRRELPAKMLVAGTPDVPALEDDRPVNEYFLIRRAPWAGL